MPAIMMRLTYDDYCHRCWPSTVPTPSLKTVLDKHARMLPTADDALNEAQAIYTELCEHGFSPDRLPIVVDCNANKARWVAGRAPC